ncbi:MAG: hypothetical protein ABWZ66_11250 [Pyrinomonadaceae bacterium]
MFEGDSKYITQKEAAELTGKSLKAIHELTNKGRWRTKTEYGKRVVNYDDVLNYKPRKSGRPRREVGRQ